MAATAMQRQDNSSRNPDRSTESYVDRIPEPFCLSVVAHTIRGSYPRTILSQCGCTYNTWIVSQNHSVSVWLHIQYVDRTPEPFYLSVVAHTIRGSYPRTILSQCGCTYNTWIVSQNHSISVWLYIQYVDRIPEPFYLSMVAHTIRGSYPRTILSQCGCTYNTWIVSQTHSISVWLHIQYVDRIPDPFYLSVVAHTIRGSYPRPILSQCGCTYNTWIASQNHSVSVWLHIQSSPQICP